MNEKRIAVVTGASSGIGQETVRALVASGFIVYGGARRMDRLVELSRETGMVPQNLDVSLPDSVTQFAESLPPSVDILVNNAGGALGLDPVIEMDEEGWLSMYQSNVLGTARMIRALYSRLKSSGQGHVVNIGSVAAIETYVGGAGYTMAKHALRALTETLRLEWLGAPIRITEIDPGLVETEFSLVRFRGDADRAKSVYAGMTPLTGGDVAEAVVWAVTRPPHVNVDSILLRPLDQARVDRVYRRKETT
ncbi:MAG: SDR family NAD(P)-dependent oxidoreductase [Nitrospiraceae bacterium]|nr:SDR family NAD(P)-dependent oxidoreductase [Nitrospiraceae bacterium]